MNHLVKVWWIRYEKKVKSYPASIKLNTGKIIVEHGCKETYARMALKIYRWNGK